GNSLLRWNDKSGYNRNATKYCNSPTNAIYNPIGFNNLPTIVFSHNQGISAPMPPGTNPIGTTIFVIFKSSPPDGQYENGTVFSRDVPITHITAPYCVRGFERKQGDGVNAVGKDAELDLAYATGLNLFTVTVTSGSWIEYLNGDRGYNRNITSYYGDTADSIYIGTNGAKSQFFIGAISEFIIYNSVLSTTKRQQIEGYLAWKWNFNNSLPTNHPYYNNKPVYIPITNNNNYQLFNNNTYANIYQRLLTASFTGINHVYNAQTLGSTNYSITGIYSGDIVDISNIYTSNFIDPNVGNNKLMYINQINLIGSSYFNYYISISGYSNANITQATLIPNFYSLGKIYDRNTYAPISYNLSGFFPSDIGFIDISNNWIANYRTNNAGTGIYIDINNIITYGNSTTINNYYINPTNTISGIITSRYIYSTGNNKNYDSTTIATITISNLIDTDTVLYNAYFDTKNAGSNKLISIALSGFVPIKLNPSNTLANMVLWFDASDPNSYSLSSGTNISQLIDKSGYSNNTTGKYGTQPTLVNN
ncbi:MAG: hypothetical protein WCL22_06925, partial [bacterium]